MAPGLNRSFDAEKWPYIPTRLWSKVREEARDLVDYQQPLGIMGFDIDKEAVRLARYCAAQAGVQDSIAFQAQPVSSLKSRYHYGYLLCNPPYGERLSEKNAVEQLYRQMGTVFSELDTWSVYILTSHPQFEIFYGRRATKKRKLYNGRIQCNLYQYFGPKPTDLKGPFAKPEFNTDDAEMK
jgi:putative N6-adenine-specific DNA methylase